MPYCVFQERRGERENESEERENYDFNFPYFENVQFWDKENNNKVPFLNMNLRSLFGGKKREKKKKGGYINAISLYR